MRIEITYPFDEFQFSDGTYFTTSGQADIVAGVEPTYGEVEGYKIATIRLEKRRDEYVEIDDDHPLFTPIMHGLERCCGDDISEAIARAAFAEYGPFRSVEADHAADLRAA